MYRFKFRDWMKSIQMLYNHYYKQFVLSHSYSIICCGLLKWRIIVSSDGDAYTLLCGFSSALRRNKETTTVSEIFMKKSGNVIKNSFIHFLGPRPSRQDFGNNKHTYTRTTDAFSCLLLAYNLWDCGRIRGQSATSLNRRWFIVWG